MANILDFLFEGDPPESVTTYGQTVENTPKWMSDYTQGLIARANAAAAEPYIPYGGPRIAAFAPEQEEAYRIGAEKAGVYEPYMQAGEAGMMGGLEAARGIVPGAQPYLDEASGRWIDPGTVESYMDPYIQNVLDRQAALSQRQMEEEFIPGLQRAFTSAGQFGSRGGFGSMEDIGIRGTRDIMENLQKQQLEALSGAYGQAAEIQARDQDRLADLAQVRGALGEAAAQQLLAGGEGYGRMAEAAQRMGLGDVGMLEAIGKARQQQQQRSLDQAYADFVEQRDLPLTRTGFMSEIIRGLPPTVIPRVKTTEAVGPADIYQPSPLSQLAGAYGVYRGLTAQKEGGYIDEDDLGDYAEGGRVFEGDYYDVDEYGLGGLARAAGEKLVGLGRRIRGNVSRWADHLRPDPSRSVGTAGGKLLKLDHKQE